MVIDKKTGEVYHVFLPAEDGNVLRDRIVFLVNTVTGVVLHVSLREYMHEDFFRALTVQEAVDRNLIPARM